MVPAIFLLASRIGVLVQNIAGPEIIQSDLGTLFEKDSNSLVVEDTPHSRDPN